MNFTFKYLIRRLFLQNSLKGAVLSCSSFFFIIGLISCGMVNEDLDPCAPNANTFTTINFVYDYNMLDKDLVNDHVGTIHLYVFDKDQTFVFDSVASRTMMTTRDVDFTMVFDTTRFKQGQKYFLVAMAQGNHAGYEASLETPGFQIPLDRQMEPGISKLSDYRIRLDRDGDQYADFGIVYYRDTYGNTREMMDTLWSTKPNNVQEIYIPEVDNSPTIVALPDEHVDVTIPLMRITNSITVNIVHDSFDTNTNTDYLNVLIDFPYGNGTLTFTGQTDQQQNQELYYRALRKNMVQYQQKSNGAQYDAETVSSPNNTETSHLNTRASTYAMQAVFGVSRLQTTDGSSLQVRNGETNEIICQIGGKDDTSFSQWLADYFKSYYGDQQFLDREYDYTIDIHLDQNMLPTWVQVGCSILGWGKRIHYYEL